MSARPIVTVFLLLTGISARPALAERINGSLGLDWYIDQSAHGDLREPAFGRMAMWYTSWYQDGPFGRYWLPVRTQAFLTPTLGHYDSAKPEIIQQHYEWMLKCGVDLIVFDDTNWVWVDDRRIDRVITAWFDFMDARPEGERLPLTMAIGGMLNQHNNREGWLNEVAYISETYIDRPSMARVDGLPLLVWYLEADAWPEWDDERFSVLRAYHAYRTEDQAKGNGWGWGSTPEPPANRYCMSFFPGWSLAGKDVIARDHGEYYKKCWLKVLKTQPEWVCIADWNNFLEETAIEDASEWVDWNGESRPNWYRWITGAYAALRSGQLRDWSYYRDVEEQIVYFYRDGELLPQDAPPRVCPVMDVPAGWLKRIAASQ